MKKEWMLLTGTVLATLLLAIGALRLFAPHLLGFSRQIDLEMVQLDEKLPPFFEGVFRDSGFSPEDPMVNDPLTGHRAHPRILENIPNFARYTPPIDMLGFRNRSVPVFADVVTIGDSQTIGVNAVYDTTWPSLLARALPGKKPVVYNMATSGWGGAHYLYAFEKALLFRPRVVVVAFYTGNDPLESVTMAYGSGPWAFLRTLETRPESAPTYWPPKEEDYWPATLANGFSTVFTPKSRLSSNDRAFPATAEGYRIMGEVGRRIAERANRAGVRVVFTIIPTKELIYAEQVEKAGLTPPEAYVRLVRDEALNIRELVRRLTGLPASAYVDLPAAMRQQAGQGNGPIYMPTFDGHPSPNGYRVIANALKEVVNEALPPPVPEGLAAVAQDYSAQTGSYVLVRDGQVWWFNDAETVKENGWRIASGLRRFTGRDLAALPNHGYAWVNPELFGPRKSPSGTK